MSVKIIDLITDEKRERYIIVRNLLSIEHEKLGILYRRASMKGAQNGNI